MARERRRDGEVDEEVAPVAEEGGDLVVDLGEADERASDCGWTHLGDILLDVEREVHRRRVGTGQTIGTNTVTDPSPTPLMARPAYMRSNMP